MFWFFQTCRGAKDCENCLLFGEIPWFYCEIHGTMASVKTENVKNFGDDEEEVYLYLDFHSIPLSEEEMKEPNLTLKIVGIESENPVVKINNKFFKGNQQITRSI